MPLDPSIPLQVQPQQSPFQALQAPVQTAQGLLALKQNQMQLGANQAISQAYAQSIDPQTGQVDFNKFQSLAGQSGAGAYLPQFMNQVLQQRNLQQTYDTSKLDMALKQQGAIRGMIGSLVMDPEMGKSDMSGKIAAQISSAVQSGILPLDQGINEMRSIPTDPGAQAQWIQNHLINSLSGEAKLQALMPQGSVINTGGQQLLMNRNPLTGQSSIAGTVNNTLTPGEALPQNIAVDTGSGTVLLNRNPVTGQSTVGTSVAKGLSASELAQPMTIIGPNGEQRQITKGQWLQMEGGSAGGYTGRYGAGGEPGGGAPGIQTSLSPAQTSALSAQGASSNAAAQTLHDAAADAPMRVNLLEQAREALSAGVDGNGNPISTGPGSDWRNTAKSFINSLSPAAAKALGWTGDVQSYDEFKKILTNYASSVSGSLGTGTDARLNAAVTGNANPNISSLANEDILAKTIAAEKMRAAQDYAFQNSGLSTDKFNQWQSQWNKSVDPSAFVFASMNPQQQQAFLSRQTPQQLQQFKASLGKLVRSGALQMPGQ